MSDRTDILEERVRELEGRVRGLRTGLQQIKQLDEWTYTDTEKASLSLVTARLFLVSDDRAALKGEKL